MSRFISWLAVGVSAAFLIVATTAFSLGALVWLAFAISVGTLVVAVEIAYHDRHYVASLCAAVVVAVISAWTVVASLVFSPATVQHLAFAAALALSGLAIVGLTANELSLEHAAQSVADTSTEREARLAAAA